VTPFKVKILGSVYNSCTNDVFERSWCPLKVDSEGFVDLLDRDNIGLCDPGCSSNISKEPKHLASTESTILTKKQKD